MTVLEVVRFWSSASDNAKLPVAPVPIAIERPAVPVRSVIAPLPALMVPMSVTSAEVMETVLLVTVTTDPALSCEYVPTSSVSLSALAVYCPAVVMSAEAPDSVMPSAAVKVTLPVTAVTAPSSVIDPAEVPAPAV